MAKPEFKIDRYSLRARAWGFDEQGSFADIEICQDENRVRLEVNDGLGDPSAVCFVPLDLLRDLLRRDK